MMLVFLAMFGVMFLMTQYFQLVLGLLGVVGGHPAAPDGADHDHRGAAHTAPDARSSARNRTVAFGMLLIAFGLLLFHQIGLHTPYWYILIGLIPLISGMALSMSPMTAAIMSAVPARRAGPARR